MPNISIETEVLCPSCSGNAVELPEDYTDDSTATCGTCRAALGRWGDIKGVTGKLLSDRAEQALSDAVKHIDGWKK